MKNIHILPTDKPSRLYKHNELGFKLLAPMPHEIGQYNGSNQHIYITSDEVKEERCWVINSMGKIESVPHSKWGKLIILTTDKDLIADGVQVIDDEFLDWFVKNPSCERVEIEKENICARCYSNDVDDCWSARECSDGRFDKIRYKIIIPSEEPKQELELKDFDNGDILDVLNMGNIQYLSNGDIIYNPNLFFIKRGNKWFMKTKKPKQETLKEAAERLYPGVDRQVDRMLFIEGAKWQAERMYSEKEVRKMLFDLGDVLFNNCQNGIKEGEPEEYFDVIIEQFKKK